MTRSLTRGAVVVSLALAMSACVLTFDSSSLGVPASMAEPAQAPPQGAAFSITKHPVFMVWGAFTLSPPDLEEILAGQLAGGSRIANLRVRIRSRWSDVLVTVLTVGLVAPRTVTFDGIVVSGAASP